MKMAMRRQTSSRRSSAITIPSQRLWWLLTSQFAILLLSSIASVVGTPISYFPLNSQLPPVARVSEPFSFTFSPLTFSSETDMSYELADGSPSWLSLDSTSRQLSGTPDDALIPPGEALVGVVITLIASDDTGSTAANVTLVVSRNLAPQVRIPLDEQIKKFGPYSAPASVLLHPSSEFEFEFDPNTFGVGVAGGGDNQDKDQDVKRDEDKSMSGPALGLSYYAVSGDNAPLPSWIEFDAGRLAFSGKTPPFESLVQPPQRFDFQLVASDVVGFSSVSVTFSIAVGSHELIAEEPIVQLNATRGKELEYTGLSEILKLDKQPLVPDNISSINANGLPSWLSFDEKSWKVSGTPDTKAEPTNITIAVVDKFSDALNVTLAVNFHTKLFISDLPSLNVSVGDDVSFDINKFLFAPLDTQITADVQPDNPWISFDDSSKVLSGTVPDDLPAGFEDEIRIAFSATNRRTKDKEAKSLSVQVIENRPTPTPTPTSTQSPSPNTDTKKRDDSRRDLYWLLVIPILLFALAIILIVFRARKRRDRSRKLDRSEVSRPVPGTFVANGFTGASLHDIRRMMDPDPVTPPEKPSDHSSGTSSNREPQTSSNPEFDPLTPHAMATGPPNQGIARVETSNSWFTRRQSRPSPGDTDEVSLLSDTSVGEAVLMTQEDLFPNARRTIENSTIKPIGLAIPSVAEPFSIQPTPELAYTAGRTTGRKYDYVSDDEKPLAVRNLERQKSSHQKGKSPSRGVQHRLSKVWKQGSPSKVLGNSKRHSRLSESTDVTTRTSILTSGVTEEATTASTNVVAKPTVIHIPSRPGEARQLSRRTNDSMPFFGGGSLTKSQRNFRLTKEATPTPVNVPKEDREPPVIVHEQDGTLDGNPTWENQGRNYLGIAYEDIAQPKRLTRQKPRTGVARAANWTTHPTDSFLVAPDQWPVPDVFIGLGGSADVFRSKSEPPQASPVTAPTTKADPPVASNDAKKRNWGFARRSTRRSGSFSSLTQSPLAHRRSKARTSREERLSIGRIREQKALDGFRAMVSAQTPSPRSEWPAPRPRQLPETPSRESRVPLADRLNESRGLKNTLSKRSVKTLQSAKSVRSVRADDNDEDAWEDIVPPESVLGEWDGVESDGSFPVYI